MKKNKKASVSYKDTLIEDLRGDEEAQISYIKASLEDNSDVPSAILSAIQNVAKARGFRMFSKKAKLNRENLYRVLSKNGNPRLDTLIKILTALNLTLSVEPRRKAG